MAADPSRLNVTTLALTLAILGAAGLAACQQGDEPAPRAGLQSASSPEPGRIVSLIPATTEMLFAMGAGDRLVGVGSYDRFPPEVERIRRVGGLIDPDTEGIIALRPDLVIVYNTQVELKQRLERAGLPYFSYEHRALPDVMETIRTLGVRINAVEQAEEVATAMERDLAAVGASVAGRMRPTTMLVFGREPGSLRNVYVSGGYGFLADLLDIAGGKNIFGDIDRQSLQASTEMMLTRRPEVIIELRYGEHRDARESSLEIADWNALASVPAVRNKRIYILTGDEFVVPGPRVVLAAQRFAQALHGAAP